MDAAADVVPAFQPRPPGIPLQIEGRPEKVNLLLPVRVCAQVKAHPSQVRAILVRVM
jgi:hypothetical protein